MSESKKYIAKYRSKVMGFGGDPKEAARHHVVDYTRRCRGELIDVDVYEAVPIEPQSILSRHRLMDILARTRELRLFGTDKARVVDDIDLESIFDEAAQLALEHIKNAFGDHYGVEVMAYVEGDFVAAYDSTDFEEIGDE